MSIINIVRVLFILNIYLKYPTMRLGNNCRLIREETSLQKSPGVRTPLGEAEASPP